MKRRTPVILQMSSVECGAACLAMLLGHFGRRTRLQECRASCSPGRSGLNVAALLAAAAGFGLRGKAFSLRAQDLGRVPTPCIVHWNANHFVVLERWSPERIDLIDPGIGRRRIGAAEFAAGWGGVVVVFEPAPGFEANPRRSPSMLRTRLVEMLRAPGMKSVLLRILGASLLLQAVAFGLPLLMRQLVDQVIPQRDLSGLDLLLAGALFVAVAGAVFALCRAALLVRLEAVLDRQLMLGFFRHLLSLPYAFFQHRSSGDLLMRLSSNSQIRESLSSATTTAVLDGSLVIVFLIALLQVSPLFGLAACAIAAVQVALLGATAPPLQRLVERELACQAESQGNLVEALQGISTLKASGKEQHALERWSLLLQRQLDASSARGRYFAGVEAILSGIRTFAPLLLLWLGGRLVLGGQMSLGTMLAINALAAAFLQPIGSLVASAQQLQLAAAHLERIADVMQAEPEQPAMAARGAPALGGAIEFKRVSFRYDAHSENVVRDVSFRVAPGQKVALVGRTGSGKSTLARLMLGLYSPSDGEILYDGVPLACMDLQQLRRQWGVALQDAFHFNSSLRDNISFGDPHLPLEEVASAAELAGLHADILEMPLRYETRIEEGGAGLSGGQRQRLAIARALAGKPRMLLLDEATSHLDTITEALVERNLDTLACTRIVVAHRLSTIQNADLILVLEGGAIVEQGTHRELLARAGYYTELVHAQQDHGPPAAAGRTGTTAILSAHPLTAASA